MNALFLAAAMLVVFAFGYRFYAKLLALDVFRLDENYSTRAQTHADGRDYVPTHPHLLFGHHLAAITGAATFAGPIVAIGWGWVPAFLWITIGTAVAAGTYGLGVFWLSVRHPENPWRTAHALIGRSARAALLLLIPPVLLILIAAAAGFTASLLAAHPGAVLPLAALALIAAALGGYLHGRAESELLPASAVAFAVSLFLLWLLGPVPLAFDGALTVTFGGRIWIAIDAVVVWVVLLLVYAFHAARLPVWRLMRPRAFLTSLLLALLLLLFYAALIVDRPALDAPEFHAAPSATGALPWLFLVVGSGALAGWQFLIVHGVSARQMRRETDARYVGYGAALAQGAVALSALLLAATAFDSRDAWSAYYAGVPAVGDFPRAVEFYVDAYARHVAALGLDTLHARNLAAAVLAGLSAAVLEAAVRTLKQFLIALAPPPAPVGRRDGERSRLWLIVVAAGVLALHDGRGLGGLAAWPVLALLSLWLAAFGFALVALALRARRQPAVLLAALAAATGALALWCSLAQLWRAWTDGAWLALAAGVGLLLLVGFVLQEAIRAAARPLALRAEEPRARLDT